MGQPVKILIVEDEMIIAANISLQLSNLGYEVTGILPRGEEAISHIRENQPDIALLDIRLKGKWDGIRTAEEIKKEFGLPVIFLTANADDAHFNRAKTARPEAFISKPFRKRDLQRAIELTASRIEKDESPEATPATRQDVPFLLEDRIFIRHKESMVKLFLEDILFVEAERNYSRIYTGSKEYLQAFPLKAMEERLPSPIFMRIHRSFLINLLRVDEVGESHVKIGTHTLPLGQGQRSRLLAHLQRI